MNEYKIKIEVKNIPNYSLEGCYAVISFVELTDLGLTSRSIEVVLDEDGVGGFFILDIEKVQGRSIDVELFGRNNFWIAERKTIGTSSLKTNNNEEVRIIQMDVFDSVFNQNLEQKTYTIEGKLIQLENNTKISQIGYAIVASKDSELNDSNYKILADGATNQSGYFSFNIDNTLSEEKLHYFLIVPASEQGYFELKTDNGIIENKQIFAVSINNKETFNNENGTPRLQNSEDFASMDGAFSQDLGIGCMEFTKPNRVLEEYEFHHIVRTTDPQIRKMVIDSSNLQEIIDELKNTGDNLIKSKASLNFKSIVERKAVQNQ